MRNSPLFTLLFPHEDHSFQAFLCLSFGSLTMMYLGLGFIGFLLFGARLVLESVGLCLLPNSDGFSHCFLEQFFTLSSLLSFGTHCCFALSPWCDGRWSRGSLNIKGCGGKSWKLEIQKLREGLCPHTPQSPLQTSPAPPAPPPAKQKLEDQLPSRSIKGASWQHSSRPPVPARVPGWGGVYQTPPLKRPCLLFPYCPLWKSSIREMGNMAPRPLLEDGASTQIILQGRRVSSPSFIVSQSFI